MCLTAQVLVLVYRKNIMRPFEDATAIVSKFIHICLCMKELQSCVLIQRIDV